MSDNKHYAHNRIEYKKYQVMNDDGTMFLEDKGTIKNKRRALFLCPLCKKNTFEATIDNVKRGQNNHCKECGNICRSKNHQRDIANQRFGNLVALYPLAKKSKGGKRFWHCRCDCGECVDVQQDKLTMLRKIKCNNCGKKYSNGELLIHNFLQKNNIIFVEQKTFESCRNPNTGNLLFFDFYIPILDILIEYDGEQHFINGKPFPGWTTEKFLEGQARDKIKDKWCRDNDKKLVRIPYWRIKDIEEILKHIIIYGEWYE